MCRGNGERQTAGANCGGASGRRRRRAKMANFENAYRREERKCPRGGNGGPASFRRLAGSLFTTLGTFAFRYFRSLAPPPFGTSAVRARRLQFALTKKSRPEWA